MLIANIIVKILNDCVVWSMLSMNIALFKNIASCHFFAVLGLKFVSLQKSLVLS